MVHIGLGSFLHHHRHVCSRISGTASLKQLIYLVPFLWSNPQEFSRCFLDQAGERQCRVYSSHHFKFLVIIIYRLDKVSFLWLNVIGALLVIFLSMVIQFSGLTGKKSLNVDTKQSIIPNNCYYNCLL